ncbi:hypothetical protein [Erythrobacter donghaensis]|uniref:hypothetical protein n=1 Tax=Erythrobacter donghaensis TaxID=267135 RepID=UPI000A38F719|nr:hypothetical protein [Erythrobacter donghaensis]
MFMRCLLAAGLALLLGGCVGWVAETRLIPVDERDTPGLMGLYVGDEGLSALIAPGDEGFLRFSDPDGGGSSDVAFDLLREEPPRPALFAAEAVEDENAAPIVPDRSFLVEFPVEGDEGKTAYAYGIVRVSGGQPAETFQHYSVLCSKAAEALAARREDRFCIFDDYARLRAAALDALAWQDDARLAVDSNDFTLKSEADPMEADAAEDAGP